MPDDAVDALQTVDVNAPVPQSSDAPSQEERKRVENVQNQISTARDDLPLKDDSGADDAPLTASKAGETPTGASVQPTAKKPRTTNGERAPREIDLDALPETLREWKTNAERELRSLWGKHRLRLLDWFEVKGSINKCIVSCPSGALREKMRELRDDGVFGSSMVPYLQLLRDVFDETDEYKDNLDDELNYDDFYDDDSEDEDSDEDEDEEDEADEEEEIPQIARAPKATPATEPTRNASKPGASRSAPTTEEMDEIRIKFSKFCQFLGQYFSEKRCEVEDVVEIVDRAREDGFEDAQEVNKFLEIMQRRNMIMYDQNDWRVYIL